MNNTESQTFASPGASEAITHVESSFARSDERVSLHPLDSEDVLVALLATPPTSDEPQA